MATLSTRQRDFMIIHLSSVNGEAAIIGHHLGVLDTVFVCSTDGERVTAIRAIRNPDKLRWLADRMPLPVGDQSPGRDS